MCLWSPRGKMRAAEFTSHCRDVIGMIGSSSRVRMGSQSVSIGWDSSLRAGRLPRLERLTGSARQESDVENVRPWIFLRLQVVCNANVEGGNVNEGTAGTMSVGAGARTSAAPRAVVTRPLRDDRAERRGTCGAVSTHFCWALIESACGCCAENPVAGAPVESFVTSANVTDLLLAASPGRCWFSLERDFPTCLEARSVVVIGLMVRAPMHGRKDGRVSTPICVGISDMRTNISCARLGCA